MEGIPRDELALALRRHATSKIASLADLEGVATMGFRGEALAAIASVSELSLVSRTADAAHATRLDASSGELAPTARAVGTSVDVRELFFATPARRKFLKTDATELAHCVDAVRRHALARPDVGFAVWHEGRLVAQWRATADKGARLADVLGTEFMAASVALQTSGRAAATAWPRRHAGRGAGPCRPAIRLRQWPLRARQAASRTACAARTRTCCMVRASRCTCCSSTSTPERVDVNVHPTKIEVRFRDAREVHQAVRHAVENALAQPRSRCHAGASGRDRHRDDGPDACAVARRRATAKRLGAAARRDPVCA